MKPPEITGPRVHLTQTQRTRGVQPWPELIEGPSRKAVLKEVGRAVAAGELAASGPLEHVGGSRYQVAVWRIRERRVERRWVRPVLITAGVGVGLAAVAAVGWWLAAATVGALSLPLIIGASAVLLLLRLVFRSPGCEIIIRHRHR